MSVLVKGLDLRSYLDPFLRKPVQVGNPQFLLGKTTSNSWDARLGAGTTLGQWNYGIRRVFQAWLDGASQRVLHPSGSHFHRLVARSEGSRGAKRTVMRRMWANGTASPANGIAMQLFPKTPFLYAGCLIHVYVRQD